MENELRLAVLIDADNAPRTALKEIMAEVAVYGSATIKRIYGDWTAPNMASWKPLLLEHAITPFQQYSYTTGKNATDSAMIIDAMDILYSGNCGGFVLVSSDSDFTRLATRLREAGMKVYGVGEKKTPKPFIVACDKFVYIEALRAAEEVKAPAPAGKAGKKNPRRPRSPLPSPFATLSPSPSKTWPTRTAMPIWVPWATCSLKSSPILTPATTATPSCPSSSPRWTTYSSSRAGRGPTIRTPPSPATKNEERPAGKPAGRGASTPKAG